MAMNIEEKKLRSWFDLLNDLYSSNNDLFDINMNKLRLTFKTKVHKEDVFKEDDPLSKKSAVYETPVEYTILGYACQYMKAYHKKDDNSSFICNNCKNYVKHYNNEYPNGYFRECCVFDIDDYRKMFYNCQGYCPDKK